MMTTLVHDTTEAVCLCQEYNLFLKPIDKLTLSVALPQLKLPGKSISNWEVMERVKAMVAPEQFSALRISKSTMDFIRFEGEVENRGVVKILLAKLDGKSIKLSGFTDILKVRAVENKMDFPTRYDWDSFFRDAKDMNDTVPGERPDTIHLEGLPCRWFTLPDGPPDRPSETALQTIFQGFGQVRHVDIPMLDPYREETLDKNFNTFTFGGHLNFEAYVQYQEYDGFAKAMDTLRGMKLMYKGEDGKAVACNIKVTFDTSKHLSDVALKRRQQERLRILELERQREELKRKEKEEEERHKEEERKQKEAEEEEKERRREERIRKREQKLRDREERRNLKKVKRRQEEEQKKLQMKIATEERRLLLAQRNLESIRLIAELLGRAKALKQQQQEKERVEREEREKEELARQKEELARLEQLEACRREQEAELRRVELEKGRALDLQRRERELRERLVGNLLKKAGGEGENQTSTQPSALTIHKGDSSDLSKTSRALGVNGVRPRGEERPRAMVRSHVTEKQMGERRGGMEERRGGMEERRGGMEERRGNEWRSREAREKPRERERSRSHSQCRRRYSHSRRQRSSSRKRSDSRRRRRSHSSKRRSESRRRRSRISKRRSDSRRRSGSRSHRRDSHHGRGRSSRSTSHDWSRSSSERSHSRGRRGHRHSRHKDSRSRSSSSSSRSRERSREKDRSTERSRDRDSRKRSRSRSRSRRH
ncbi:A-kinase anchor protein 17A [Salmo salar]|uniref:A-kinase anchor protein 17A n=1 Tax=Salmo salar TaxID=8030 RepID=A0A1S3NYV0_SALSA|nr:A-kinase anchor protein 17A [Salmo salar]